MALDQILDPNSGSLPFSLEKQDAVLGYLLKNEQFFHSARGKIEPEFFTDKTNGRIYRAKLNFYKEFKRIPSQEELRSLSEFVLEDAKTRNAIFAKINLAEHQTTQFGLDAIVPELTGWMQARVYKLYTENGARLYNNKKHVEAFVSAKEMVKKIEEIKFDEDNQARFDNYVKDFQDSEAEYSDALTFGNEHFDRLLTPKAQSGSLLLGDTTVVLAPTNVGKSTCLITVIKNNIFARKPTLWITHEGREADLKEKLWCSVLNISPSKLFELYKTSEGRQLLDMALGTINRYLTYIPMNKAGLTVEDVEIVIRKRCEEWAQKHNGEKIALVVDDYPAKLSTNGYKSGNASRRDKDEYVYNHFVQLALEYKFHSLLAIQTNREGSKVNKQQKGYEQRLIGMEDVLESWGPMTIATNVISINRDPLAEMQDRVTFHICKSRSSIKGWSVVCRSKFAHAITHDNKLPTTWYRGIDSMSEKLDLFLEKYPGQAIPENEWR